MKDPADPLDDDRIRTLLHSLKETSQGTQTDLQSELKRAIALLKRTQEHLPTPLDAAVGRSLIEALNIILRALRALPGGGETK